MGHRIKVTGYIDTDDLHEDDVDLDDETGLSAVGFDAARGWELGTLDDLDFEIED